LTAMIILHFYLLPQFIYELFHINFTDVNLPPPMPDQDNKFGGSLV